MKIDRLLASLAASALAMLTGCAGSSQSAPASSTSSATSPRNSFVALPDGESGIGFDDLRYSRTLSKVLVPGGRTGNLVLIDPASRSIQVIAGFSAQSRYGGGHGEGTTSVDEGGELLFAIDRTTKELVVVDPETKSIGARASLTGSPDYVRFVAPTHELWVTEPDAETIEIFSAPKDARESPRREATIAIPGGPESLVVDASRGRAYTHLWESTTLAIDLKSRAVVARWPNGCSGSRGIALDEAHGFLFVGCAEGRAVVLDVAHHGKVLSSIEAGSGVDIIDYDPGRGHLYFPGAKSATMAILGVSARGELALLGTFPTASGSKAVVCDGAGRAFVAQPEKGRLLVIEDPFPASLR